MSRELFKGKTYFVKCVSEELKDGFHSVKATINDTFVDAICDYYEETISHLELRNKILESKISHLEESNKFKGL